MSTNCAENKANMGQLGKRSIGSQF